MVTHGLKTVFEPRGVEVGAEGAGAHIHFQKEEREHKEGRWTVAKVRVRSDPTSYQNP